jgi:hypothetical protein
MKTIYSLKEFHEKAVEISGKDSSEVLVRVEYGIFHKVEFKCYVTGYDFYTGRTMEESLQKLNNAINPTPPIQQNIDVEIDIEQPEESVII